MGNDSQRPSIIRKLVVSVVLGVLAWVVSGMLGFPHVFQVMFVIYVGLGFLVFVLLDAPALPSFSGWKVGVGLVTFYLLISGLYILGASALPQYDPDVEKDKIEKILKRKRELLLEQSGQTEALLAKIQTLEQDTAALASRLRAYAPAAPTVASAVAGAPGEGISVLDRGKEVYDLYECYNCHKIGGKGGVKKRGPVLDNIGTFLTVQDIKRKVFDPTYLYAEGFEEEHKKGRMPDKYKDLMTEEEVTALATYLGTLKDTTAMTPKPVFVKSDVQHGFTVFGYVRDKAGNPVAGLQVHATPQKPGGHGASAQTNDGGYYEIFMHMHNEDAGTTVLVEAQGAKQEFIANFDPNDKVTKRQKAIDLVLPST